MEYNIKPPQQKIPISGTNGEKGTLKGLGLNGSVFLKIKTATHTIMNDAKVPKLQSSAAVDIFKNKDPDIQIIPTIIVNRLGV